MTAPLRVGILGAARIADEASSPRRGRRATSSWPSPPATGPAQVFAAEYGIAKVHDTYAGVIADPDVDLVNNALVNSLHAQWNIAALQAGKNVLSEKPLTSNAEQADPAAR